MAQKIAPSDFHVFTVEGKDLLLHVPTSRVFQIDQLIRTLLELCSEEVSEEVLIRHLEPQYPQEQIREAIEELKGIGGIDESCRSVDQTSEDELRIENVMLNLAEVCNLSCTYCFAEQGDYGQEAKFMSWEVARAAIDLVLRQPGCSQECLVCFFGGEPLLNLSLLQRVVLHAKEQFARHGRKVGFSVTTNGTLMSRSIIKFLNENKFGILISLDGPQPIHDRWRKFKNGRGSYRKIVGNLRDMLRYWKDASPKANIMCRATITPLDPNPHEIITDLEKLGFPLLLFEPVSVSPFENHNFHFQESSLAEYKYGFQCLAKSWKESLLAGRFRSIYPITDRLKKIRDGEVKYHPCGAGRLFFTVSANGDLYPCHRLVGQKDHQIGSVFEGIDETLRLKALPRSILEKRECPSCWAKHFCGGGCPAEQIEAYGSDDRPMPWRCNLFRHEMEWSMWLYAAIEDLKPGLLNRIAERTLPEGSERAELEAQVC